MAEDKLIKEACALHAAQLLAAESSVKLEVELKLQQEAIEFRAQEKMFKKN